VAAPDEPEAQVVPLGVGRMLHALREPTASLQDRGMRRALG